MSKKVKVDELVIDGTVYVPKEEAKKTAINTEGLRYVMIRTYSAGVHCGWLSEQDGKEVVLVDAIRIYYWDGACSLSQLAMEGTKKPENCKFAIPVTRIELTAIEIIDMTEDARENITNTPSWKK